MTNYPEAFNSALKIILKLEGGFNINPADPGGATNLGISLRAVKLRDFDRDHKLDFDLDKDGDVDEADIHLISEALSWPAVQAFYYNDYWLLAGCNKYGSHHIGVVIFDCAVNQGVRTAVELCKEFENDGEDVFYLLYRRLCLYAGYKNAPTFIKGWGDRLERLRKELGI